MNFSEVGINDGVMVEEDKWILERLNGFRQSRLRLLKGLIKVRLRKLLFSFFIARVDHHVEGVLDTWMPEPPTDEPTWGDTKKRRERSLMLQSTLCKLLTFLETLNCISGGTFNQESRGA